MIHRKTKKIKNINGYNSLQKCLMTFNMVIETLYNNNIENKCFGERLTMNYSCERVSTLKQDEKRQELALNNIKIDKRYIDKLSGKNTDRPELNKLMLVAAKGDNIYCESISRLGRNVDDLQRFRE